MQRLGSGKASAGMQGGSGPAANHASTTALAAAMTACVALAQLLPRRAALSKGAPQVAGAGWRQQQRRRGGRQARPAQGTAQRAARALPAKRRAAPAAHHCEGLLLQRGGQGDALDSIANGHHPPLGCSAGRGWECGRRRSGSVREAGRAAQRRPGRAGRKQAHGTAPRARTWQVLAGTHKGAGPRLSGGGAGAAVGLRGRQHHALAAHCGRGRAGGGRGAGGRQQQACQTQVCRTAGS